MTDDRLLKMTSEELEAFVAEHHEAALKGRQVLEQRQNAMDNETQFIRFVTLLLAKIPPEMNKREEDRPLVFEITTGYMFERWITGSDGHRKVMAAIEEKFGVNLTVVQVPMSSSGLAERDPYVKIEVRFERRDADDSESMKLLISEQLQRIAAN